MSDRSGRTYEEYRQLYWDARDRVAELEAERDEWVKDNVKLEAKITELEDQITEIPTLCRKYEAKITELKNLIADLQCTGVYCGLDGCLCDNCRTKAKAFGDK